MKLAPLFISIFVWIAAVTPGHAVETEALKDSYDRIHAEAVKLAGTPGDIPPRVRALYQIYEDSRENHVFPLIAAHGALWGNYYFKVTGPIGKIVSYRYFYDSEQRRYREELLAQFADNFKSANQQVFIDTYTNYYFTRDYGNEPGADKFVKPELLRKLLLVHQARERSQNLPESEKRLVFKTALLFEQETSVGPRVAEAVRDFDCPILRTLILKPVVRFPYFPAYTAFYFDDFSRKSERIHYALKSYDLAVDAGWGKVESDLLKKL